MDNLTDNATTYREIVKQVIGKYAQLKPSHGEIRLDPVFDEIRDRYALMQVGWIGGGESEGTSFISRWKLVKYTLNMMVWNAALPKI